MAGTVACGLVREIEGIELDDAWQEKLRQVADGRVTAEELIQQEIGQHLSDRWPLLLARVGLPTQQVWHHRCLQALRPRSPNC
jgi:hypothetical protein